MVSVILCVLGAVGLVGEGRGGARGWVRVIKAGESVDEKRRRPSCSTGGEETSMQQRRRAVVHI